jgi:hypothetical protein
MKSTVARLLLLASALHIFLTAPVVAQLPHPLPRVPVLNPENGHYYEIVRQSRLISFDEALWGAAARSHLGIPGHLVTITSPTEQDFLAVVFQLASSSHSAWIAASDAEMEGDWRWVAGPEKGQLFWRGDYTNGTPFGYQSWLYDAMSLRYHEPNDSSSRYWDIGEDYATMRLGNTPTRPNIFGQSAHWNDVAAFDDTWPGNSFNPRSYIVEYSPIPEPTASALLVIGALIALRKRQKQSTA